MPPAVAPASGKPLPPKKRTYWRQLGWFTLGAIIFGFLEFAYQYYVLVPGGIETSLVRSFGISGVMCFTAALFLSTLFRWFPRLAPHWRFRRYAGVAGFIFITFHILFATGYLYLWDIRGWVYSYNPFVNPVLFGLLAWPIFFVMTATSTDWAMAKLGGKRWKNLHRSVYVAYLLAIFHFLTINPTALKNPPGYLLLSFVAVTLCSMGYWFVKIVRQRKFRTWGLLYGIILILLAIAFAWGYSAFVVAPL